MGVYLIIMIQRLVNIESMDSPKEKFDQMSKLNQKRSSKATDHGDKADMPSGNGHEKARRDEWIA